MDPFPGYRVDGMRCALSDDNILRKTFILSTRIGLGMGRKRSPVTNHWLKATIARGAEFKTQPESAMKIVFI